MQTKDNSAKTRQYRNPYSVQNLTYGIVVK